MTILLILLQLYTPRINVYYNDNFGADKAIPLFIATEAVKHVNKILEQDTLIVWYDTLILNDAQFISIQGDTMSYNFGYPENFKRIVVKLKTH